MQTKVLLQRLKRLEKKARNPNNIYIFIGTPTKQELNKLNRYAKIIVFTGEEDILD